MKKSTIKKLSIFFSPLLILIIISFARHETTTTINNLFGKLIEAILIPFATALWLGLLGPILFLLLIAALVLVIAGSEKSNKTLSNIGRILWIISFIIWGCMYLFVQYLGAMR